MKTPKLTKRNGKLFAGKEEVRAISIDNEWSPADAAMLTLQTETIDLSFDFDPESDLIQQWGAVEWTPKMVLEAVKELIDITDKRVWKWSRKQQGISRSLALNLNGTGNKRQSTNAPLKST